VSSNDVATLQATTGVQLNQYLWLGAKHMLTGWDHLLFLLGVIFYIKKSGDILILVSLFSIGHSLTLIFGVAFSFGINIYLIDAVIGFSVAYKGFDNLKGFTLFSDQRPDERLVVFIFGLFHGIGLATTLQTLSIKKELLIENLLAFNLGIEFGQIAALTCALIILSFLHQLRDQKIIATSINSLLIFAGFILITFQLRNYLYSI
jgi:hypothetical protein